MCVGQLHGQRTGEFWRGRSRQAARRRRGELPASLMDLQHRRRARSSDCDPAEASLSWADLRSLPSGARGTAAGLAGGVGCCCGAGRSQRHGPGGTRQQAAAAGGRGRRQRWCVCVPCCAAHRPICNLPWQRSLHRHHYPCPIERPGASASEAVVPSGSYPMPAIHSLWIVGRNGGLLYSRVSEGPAAAGAVASPSLRSLAAPCMLCTRPLPLRAR